MRISLSTDLAKQAMLNTNVQPIWDEAQIAQTSNATQFLFQTGQSTRSLAQTNLALPGQISAPDHFVLRGFMLALMPRSAAAAGYVATSDSLQDVCDWQRWLHQCIFRFTVNSTNSPVAYGHAALFPAGIGLDGALSTGGNTTASIVYALGNGQRQLQNRFGLGADYAEYLQAGEQFRGSFEYPVACSFSNSFSVRPYLTGFWSQAVR